MIHLPVFKYQPITPIFRLRTLLSLVVFLLVTHFLGGCSQSAQTFTSVDITGANYGKDFSLTDHNGKSRSLSDFSGKVVIVFFGFTQCPDVCPTTLNEMTLLKKQLGEDGQRLQVLFVTVDPERDTPELLKAYMANFDPGFLALTGSLEQLQILAKDFKVYFKKVPGKTTSSYTMDHSAGSYIFDPQGRLRLFSQYGAQPELLAQDIKKLLQ